MLRTTLTITLAVLSLNLPASDNIAWIDGRKNQLIDLPMKNAGARAGHRRPLPWSPPTDRQDTAEPHKPLP